MKKNLFKILFMFSFVFLLTRVQVGQGKVYMGQNGGIVTNAAEAIVYDTIAEAYNAQIQIKDEWEIESIN